MAYFVAALTPSLQRGYRLSALLLIIAPATLLFAIAFGSISIDWMAGARAWLAGETNQAAAIVELRGMRALTAFAVGGALALAGALLQVLLRNPLADPYILGVSGGAAVGALSAMTVGLAGAWVSGSAFAGAVATIFLVFGLSRAGSAPHRLLLIGIVLASGWGAVISLLLLLSADTRIHGMLYWLLGDLSAAAHPLPGLAILLIGFALTLPLARPLNLLASGELQAKALGLPTEALRTAIYFLSALLTASAVALAGTVGFVGLLVPHLVRLLAGADHRQLLGNAVLLGGSFLVLADTFARSLLAPLQLPVGVFTAVIGVPVFLYLLLRTPR